MNVEYACVHQGMNKREMNICIKLNMRNTWKESMLEMINSNMLHGAYFCITCWLRYEHAKWDKNDMLNMNICE
jgi:hypothetical protein